MPVPEAVAPESDVSFVKAGIQESARLQEGVPLKTHATETSVIEDEPVVEKVVKDAVVREHVHPSLVEHVQPVIERDVYQTHIKPVIQTVHESEQLPAQVIDRRLEKEEHVFKETPGAPRTDNLPRSSTEIMPTENQRIVHEPVVIERVHPVIREEVVPVIERDIYQPKEVIITHNIHEEIIQAPQYEPVTIIGDAAERFVTSERIVRPPPVGVAPVAETYHVEEPVHEHHQKKGFKKFLEKVGLTHHDKHDKHSYGTHH